MRHPERDGIPHVNRRHLIQAGLGVGAGAAFAHPFPWSRATGALAGQATPQAGGTLVAAAAGDPQFDPYYRIVPAWWSYGTLYNALYDYSGRRPDAGRTATRRVG